MAICTNNSITLSKEEWLGVNDKVSELQSEVERLKEALIDIRDHSQNPFSGHKWPNYCLQVAEEALSSSKEAKDGCVCHETGFRNCPVHQDVKE